LWIPLVLALASCQSSISLTSSIGSESTSSSSEEVIPTPVIFPRGNATTKRIATVDRFPAIPANYLYYDYKNAAVELDRILFGFANDETARLPSYISSDPSSWSPLGYWLDQPRQPPTYDPLVTGYLRRTNTYSMS